MIERCSIPVRQALLVARKVAGRTGSPSLGTEHLLASLLRVDGDLIRRFAANITSEDISEKSVPWRSHGTAIPDSQDMPCSGDVSNVLATAKSLAANCNEIKTSHILHAMMSDPACHAYILLAENGASPEATKLAVEEADCISLQPGVDFSSIDISDLFS